MKNLFDKIKQQIEQINGLTGSPLSINLLSSENQYVRCQVTSHHPFYDVFYDDTTLSFGMRLKSPQETNHAVVRNFLDECYFMLEHIENLNEMISTYNASIVKNATKK